MDIHDLIKQNVDLAPLTTFGIEARTALYAEYPNVRQLDKLSRTREFLDNEVLHIGAGSNLLFVHDFDGIVLHSAIRGMVRYDKDAETVYAIAGAGEDMDSFIAWTIENGLSGLENLSGIPGEAGASAVQNVGAYGVEAGKYIHAVECFDLETRRTVTLTGDECGFGYRDSRFKHEWKRRYIVLRVSFRLDPSGKARHLDYGPLRTLAERLGHDPSPAEVRQEVIAVRNAKLPDPKVIGSAGSFFKNPVVSEYFFREEILRHNPQVPHYPAGEGHVKLAAGWLIEHSGLKGYRIGGAEVYPRQCLVIANTGHATAGDVVELSRHIQEKVEANFGVRLQPEVNFIDTDIDVTVLGSGTSKGVPEIGCRCDTCSSTDIHDKRGRASVLVSTHGLNILIDASADFRRQALDNDITRLDAVLITHSHYDHVGGLDDLRPLCATGEMPIYVSTDVDADLRRRLDYCFRPSLYPGVPTLTLRTIDDIPFTIDGVKIIPIRVMHGKLPIFGYRIGKFAYITDASHIDEREEEKLIGVDTLIVNALRKEEHFAHFNLQQALDMIERIKPRRAYLTHLCHQMPRHNILNDELPENVHVAFDGMKLKVR